MLMAYGAPSSIDDVGDFFTHIRHGRRPPEEKIEELKGRYRTIGGGESLLRITTEQAAALEAKLSSDGGDPVNVFYGMRHAKPFIAERAEALKAAGIRRLVGLPLAPHYSTMSVGAYHDALRSATESLDPAPRLHLIDSWHDHPLFIAALAEALQSTLTAFRDATKEPIRILFTAHSLPERIVAAGEPYRDQLHATARLTAASSSETDWEFAFQSASPTGEPWLGPDIFEVLKRLRKEGRRAALIQPVGFVADHLEILYDIDVLCRRLGEEIGMEVRRTPSMNARPAFITALAAIVRERLGDASHGAASRRT